MNITTCLSTDELQYMLEFVPLDHLLFSTVLVNRRIKNLVDDLIRINMTKMTPPQRKIVKKTLGIDLFGCCSSCYQSDRVHRVTKMLRHILKKPLQKVERLHMMLWENCRCLFSLSNVNQYQPSSPPTDMDELSDESIRCYKRAFCDWRRLILGFIAVLPKYGPKSLIILDQTPIYVDWIVTITLDRWDVPVSYHGERTFGIEYDHYKNNLIMEELDDWQRDQLDEHHKHIIRIVGTLDGFCRYRKGLVVRVQTLELKNHYNFLDRRAELETYRVTKNIPMVLRFDRSNSLLTCLQLQFLCHKMAFSFQGEVRKTIQDWVFVQPKNSASVHRLVVKERNLPHNNFEKNEALYQVLDRGDIVEVQAVMDWPFSYITKESNLIALCIQYKLIGLPQNLYLKTSAFFLIALVALVLNLDVLFQFMKLITRVNSDLLAIYEHFPIFSTVFINLRHTWIVVLCIVFFPAIALILSELSNPTRSLKDNLKLLPSVLIKDLRNAIIAPIILWLPLLIVNFQSMIGDIELTMSVLRFLCYFIMLVLMFDGLLNCRTLYMYVYKHILTRHNPCIYHMQPAPASQ